MTARGEMTDDEQELSAQVNAAIQGSMHDSERSVQAKAFQLGVSDLGTCQERTRRLLAQIPETDQTDMMAAFIGTWVGTGVEAAVKARYPGVICQATVATKLWVPSSAQEYGVIGHPDLIFPWGVADSKTVNGLESTKRDGPNQQQLFQRHLYTKAAHEQGLLDCELLEAKTANIWLDRSGATPEVFVHMDDYSPDVVMAAALWLEDVFYALDHDIPAAKEPPRTWCAKACGHFQDCRKFDSDVEGLITDESIISAILMHQEGKALADEGARLKKEASAALSGVAGYTREYQVRWVHINATEPKMGNGRRAHDRLSITPIAPDDAR